MAKPDHIDLMERKQRQAHVKTERQAAAKEEALAVARGVEETVGLRKGRGEEFDAPKPKRGGRMPPVRRLTGLQWVTRRGLLNPRQLEAGEKYGAVYREANREASLRSVLDREVRGEPTGDMLRQAERANQARAVLNRYRTWIGYGQLIDVCDEVCGKEMTPREAGGNGPRGEMKEALLLVALDLLSREGTTPSAATP